MKTYGLENNLCKFMCKLKCIQLKATSETYSTKNVT